MVVFVLSIEKEGGLGASLLTRMSWWKSGSRLIFLTRRSSPLPGQVVQVAGLTPSGVFQMALNSLLKATPLMMFVGNARASEETIITRALTGFSDPLFVWGPKGRTEFVAGPILRFGSMRKARAKRRELVVMALTGSDN